MNNKTSNSKVGLYGSIAATIFALVLFIIGYVAFTSTGKGNEELGLLLRHQVNTAKQLEEIVKLLENVQSRQSSLISANQRLGSQLSQEFEDDQLYLNEVVKLKKERLRAELESEIARLRSVGLAGSDSSIAVSPISGGSAAEKLAIFLINYTDGTAMVSVGDYVQPVSVGDTVLGFTVDSIDKDSVTFLSQSGNKEVLRLTYSTVISRQELAAQERDQAEEEGDTEQ